MLFTPLYFGLAATRRMMSYGSYIATLQKQHATSRHWYLFILGVDPEWQGKGVGGRLLAPVLQEADQEGLPCYLKTVNEQNLVFYERQGFTVVDRGAVPKDGPRVWAMLRRPVPPEP